MEQSRLVELIANLEDNQVLVVEAEAGSGKTWSAMAAIAALPDSAKVFVAAPTWVAVEELQSKLWPETVANVQFGSTASLVGRFLEMDKSVGQLRNQFSAKLVDYDLLILDEVGATPEYDVCRILANRGPVVLLGDRSQLGPVQAKEAKLFADGWTEYEHKSFTFVTLDGQRRVQGPTQEFVRRLRTEDLPLAVSFDRARVLYSRSDFESDFFSHLQTAIDRGLPLVDFCLVAYRNCRVDELRQKLRDNVFQSDNFVPGEPVRVQSSKYFRTGKVLTVTKSESSWTQIGSHRIQTTRLTYSCGRDETVVHPVALPSYYQLLTDLKAEQRWDEFFELDALSTVNSSLVSTVHCCQGRSIKYVWADSQDIGSRQRLRYVAYSRFSEYLTVVWPRELWAISKKLLAGYTDSQLTNLRPAITLPYTTG